MTSRTSTLTFILLALVITAGCGTRDSAVRRAPIGVAVTRVTSEASSDDLAYSGTIEESVTIPLSFQMPGTVARVFVHEGETVRPGQALAALDNTSSASTHEMMRAAEKRAEDAHRRLMPMHENGTIPEIRFIEVETALAQARAATAIARKTLDDCTLRATVGGVVGRCTIDPGMVVVPGVSTITIVNIHRVFATVSVSEGEIAALTPGRPARITVLALGGRVFTGRIGEIGVMADPIAHTYNVRVAIENRDLALRPGMVCSVVLGEGSGSGHLAIPPRAIVRGDDGRTHVYVVDAAMKAEWREVKTGRLLNENVEILAGLTCGERVVISGQHRLFPRAAVRIDG